ncbi:MAG: hypothetical protein Homavirus2_18 [Homavirus sp.]|uniref:Uncharacterized protein n=1 Tax=Homavirus sp. TaxID=2487769 RepID=A0A3G5A697_9VIRU|nr:MAG: hypothetical protein Homavirus2_18 [Homavirus sp.]
MVFTYLKNPVVLGILSATFIYLYMYWDAERKYKEDKSIKRKQVNILIPAAIGVIIWFLASTYFDKEHNNTDSMIINLSSDKNPIELSDTHHKYKLVESNKDSSLCNRDEFCNKSYHIIGKNKVRLPPTDVFIDVAKF